MDLNQIVAWLQANWQLLSQDVLTVGLCALWLRSLGREKVAQLLGHVILNAVLAAEKELVQHSAEMPVEQLQAEVARLYDVFLAKFPPQMQLLIEVACSKARALEMAKNVWTKWHLNYAS